MPDHETVARELLAAIQKARAGVAAINYTIPTVFGGPHHGLEVPGSLIGTLGEQQNRRPTPWIRLQMPTAIGHLAAARYTAEPFTVAQAHGTLSAWANLHEPDRQAISDALWKLVPSLDWTR